MIRMVVLSIVALRCLLKRVRAREAHHN
jgi:hypothetical protein